MNEDALSATFHALADPTRRAILARLSLGEATVTELVAPFDMSQPAISKHLKVLENAGLITRTRDGAARPCRLEALRLKEATEWMEQWRKHWNESLDRLDDLLRDMKAESERNSRDRK